MSPVFIWGFSIHMQVIANSKFLLYRSTRESFLKCKDVYWIYHLQNVLLLTLLTGKRIPIRCRIGKKYGIKVIDYTTVSDI